MLLVLDDLQWADRPTLAAAPPSGTRDQPLAPADPRRLPGDRDARTAASPTRSRRCGARGWWRSSTIGGLSEGETTELIRVQTGTVPSRTFARALYAETEGNPFFVGEIVRHLSEAGVRADRAGALELQRAGLPEGVKDVIARRLARLDAQAIEWLRAAAVIGRDFDSALLERVVSLERG